MTSSHADWRLLIPISLVFIASIQLEKKNYRIKQYIFAGLCLLFLCVRIQVVTEEWGRWQEPYRDMTTAIEKIEEGSKIFSITAYQKQGKYTYQGLLPLAHAPSYAVILKSAFVPTLFAFEKQQPLSYTPGYKSLSKNAKPQFYLEQEDVDWNTIKENYDFLLISNWKFWGKQIPDNDLELVYQSDLNSLYKTKSRKN